MTLTAVKPAEQATALLCFEISQKTLQAALLFVSKAVPKNSVHPDLMNVVITVHPEGQVSISATDLFFGIEETCACTVISPGSVSLSAKLLTDLILTYSPDHPILISIDADLLVTVKQKSAVFKFLGAAPNELLKLPDLTGAWHEISSEDMLRELSVVFAAADDVSKQILCGVNVNISDQLFLSATDGHRLAIAASDLPNSSDKIVMTILPDALESLGRYLRAHRSGVETVSLRLDSRQKQAEFRAGTVRLVATQIEGTYPDCRSLMPSQFSRVVTIDRKELLDRLNRVAVFLLNRQKGVTIRCDAENQEMAVEVETPDWGNAYETLPMSMTGDTLALQFNLSYLVDALKALHSDEVTMHFNTRLSPVVLKPVDSSQVSILTMPIESRQ